MATRKAIAAPPVTAASEKASKAEVLPLGVRGPTKKGEGWQAFEGDKKIGPTHPTKGKAKDYAYERLHEGRRAKIREKQEKDRTTALAAIERAGRQGAAAEDRTKAATAARKAGLRYE